MSKVRIGIIGSRFQADCIAGAVKAVPEEGEVVAVASPTKGHAAGFAKRHGIPRAFTDYRELLRDPQVEMISITAPNRLHAQITIDAAKAGKHVRSEEHTSELQSRLHLVCRLLLEKKKKQCTKR